MIALLSADERFFRCWNHQARYHHEFESVHQPKWYIIRISDYINKDIGMYI